MNNLENTIKTNASSTSEKDITLFILLCDVFIVFASWFIIGLTKDSFNIIIFLLACFFLCLVVFDFKLITKDLKSINLKKEYKITVIEKDNILELICNKKEDSYEFVKEKININFLKEKENNYYVYFDNEEKDKKSITIEEIQHFFKNNVDYSYYKSLENFKSKDFKKK